MRVDTTAVTPRSTFSAPRLGPITYSSTKSIGAASEPDFNNLARFSASVFSSDNLQRDLERLGTGSGSLFHQLAGGSLQSVPEAPVDPGAEVGFKGADGPSLDMTPSRPTETATACAVRPRVRHGSGRPEDGARVR